MLCPLLEKRNPDVLLDYCSQKLDSDNTVALEGHLRVCPDCAVFVNNQAKVWAALDIWEAEPVSPDFDAVLYAKIGERANQHWAARFWNELSWARFYSPFGWKPAMPLATACLTLAAAVALYLPVGRPFEVNNGHEQTVKAETVDVDQADRTLEDMEMLRQLAPAPVSSSHNI